MSTTACFLSTEELSLYRYTQTIFRLAQFHVLQASGSSSSNANNLTALFYGPHSFIFIDMDLILVL